MANLFFAKWHHSCHNETQNGNGGAKMTILTRAYTQPEDSFFLFGPRGTGKSTLMRTLNPDALWVDLLRPETLRRYLARPELLHELLHAAQPQTLKTVVIDEVQRAPALLSIVHEVIEHKKGFRFILTGSSARKLKRTSADLLGGRALRRSLHPFMACELDPNFSLSQALQYGTLPLLHDKKNPGDTLEAYIALYLQEEIQAEGLVRHVENFARFLEVIAFSHGAQLNLTNIARESEVKRKTLENYLAILEDLLLAFQISNFTKRAQRALSVHPKFYLFDAGVFRTLRRSGPFDRVEEAEGAALEGLIASHLRTWNEYSGAQHSLHFWRTRSGVEVDFILYGPLGLFAFEVKNSDNISIQDIHSLEIFLEDYPIAKTMLLYRGSELRKIKNTLCVPCESFLRGLKPHQNPVFNFISF
jgi:predicted AAA+ superfamily ATPase